MLINSVLPGLSHTAIFGTGCGEQLRNLIRLRPLQLIHRNGKQQGERGELWGPLRPIGGNKLKTRGRTSKTVNQFRFCSGIKWRGVSNKV